MPSVQVRILGPLEVRSDDRLMSVGGRKQRAVLGVLALRANETVLVENLVAAVWGESATVDAALGSLKVYVSNLRKLLGPTGGPGSQRIARTAGGYRLQLDENEFDLSQFRQDLDAARGALDAGDLQAAAVLFRRAEALWRGPPLPELADAVDLQPELRALQEAWISAVEDRVDVDLALRGHADVVEQLHRLVSNFPLRERLHGQLILALYRGGRQADALAAYRRLRKTLADELGIDPSPALQRLEQSVLAQDRALDPPEPARAQSGRRPSRLPPPPNELVGREEETATIAALLRTRSARIITLFGPAGVGKTRLALAAGHAAADDFVHGACLVTLGSLTDVALVPTAVAAAVGVSLSATTDPADQVVAALEGRDLCLVLDNLEHLPGVEAFVSSLAEGAPGVTILVTSRTVLGLSAERVIPVTPLDLPTSEDHPRQVAGRSAVRLFVQRAEAVGTSVSPTQGDLNAVAEICRALDGLPLAIELAASRTRLLSPHAILERLSRRLRALGIYRLDSGPFEPPSNGAINCLNPENRRYSNGSPCSRAASTSRMRRSSAVR
jgi:DNA-binding SARP family transcriptional activator